MSNFPKNQILQELRMFELLRCDTRSERAARAGCRFQFGCLCVCLRFPSDILFIYLTNLIGMNRTE